MTKQKPLTTSQHAPLHGLGTHDAPTGPHTPAHSACVVMMHWFVLVRQHGPTGGHGLGEHVLPRPSQLPPAATHVC